MGVKSRKEEDAGEMLDGRENERITIFLLAKAISKRRHVLVPQVRKLTVGNGCVKADLLSSVSSSLFER